MAIITFADIHGVEQTLDTGRKFNVAYNADCMDFLRACPDGCFDLAVVDPPYGDGSSQIVQVERERERGGVNHFDSTEGIDGTDTSTPRRVARTGGTWAEKYGKKS